MKIKVRLKKGAKHPTGQMLLNGVLVNDKSWAKVELKKHELKEPRIKKWFDVDDSIEVKAVKVEHKS